MRNKKIILTLVFPLLTLVCAGQISLRVTQVDYQSMSTSQLQSVLESQPKNDLAWYSLYMNLREDAWNGPTKEVSSGEAKALNEVATAAYTNVPNSYAGNVLYYLESDYDPEALPALKEAQRISPLSTEVRELMVAHYLANSDDQELGTHLSILHQSGKYGSDLLTYARDVLMMLPENAALVTNGSDDTYPILITQYLFGLRKDVFVIPLDLCVNEDFRAKISANTGVDVDKLSGKRRVSAEQLIKSTNRSVHFGLTLPNEWLTIDHDYQLAGFSITKNDPIGYDGLAQKFLSTIDVGAIPEKSKVSVNYLPFLFYMHEYCERVGPLDRQADIESKIRAIAEHLPAKEDVLQRLEP
ncbi:MAG: hypothetical protein MK081_04460 [Flavobacteriales bacterium]|nr:hypothetical protein [Flavobacteriales bacterium]